MYAGFLENSGPMRYDEATVWTRCQIVRNAAKGS
jgi:hypothetical protein